MLTRFRCCAMLAILTLCSAPATAQDIEELLLNALKDFAEQKAEEAGLLPQEQNSELPAQETSLIFHGVALPEPDVFYSLHTDTNNHSSVSAEQECFDRVQGKQAWNAAGNTSWNPSSIRSLCQGTTLGSAPPSCFNTAMFHGAAWGKRVQDTMSWSLASRLCQGTNSATKPINCLKSKLKGKRTLNDAIDVCSGRNSKTPPVLTGVILPGTLKPAKQLKETECYNYVQGRIAWDAAGKSKKWNPENIKQLCEGTTSAYSPGNCFSYVLHKGSQWGKKSKHRVTWREASKLCAGTNNAQQVTACFKQAIQQNKSVTQAIVSCR
ncbi:hypothetical protein GCM10008090_29510 [Arenicella chitinivorans]|uniref:C-type lectin domain-containing protein n=1 Tax=Arenicella chitinivorans TaxID=1329800 RepID=A0A918VRX5_9GAMM|nr:hypothetical protein [Arenicella chitinivorans]GHA17890.1 hypothetical protein GCM10008090_29510 [Arenicella chitinivorans]